MGVRMRRIIVGLLCASLLTGCATQGGGPFARSAATERPSFSYASASDGVLRVNVESVTFHGDAGFVPADRNWIQLRLIVRNEGREPVMLSSIRGRLPDGTIFASAHSIAETQKPPNIARDAAVTGGVMAAGHMAGMFLFPWAGVLTGVAIQGADVVRQGRRNERLDGRGRDLVIGQIPPNSQLVGNVYLPALKDQSEVLVSYVGSRGERTVTLRRVNSREAVGPESAPVTQPAALPSVRCTARACNIRAAPSTKSAVLTSVPQGTQLQLRSRGSAPEWHHVTAPDGRAGYVSSTIVQ